MKIFIYTVFTIQSFLCSSNIPLFCLISLYSGALLFGFLGPVLEYQDYSQIRGWKRLRTPALNVKWTLGQLRESANEMNFKKPPGKENNGQQLRHLQKREKKRESEKLHWLATRDNAAVIIMKGFDPTQQKVGCVCQSVSISIGFSATSPFSQLLPFSFVYIVFGQIWSQYYLRFILAIINPSLTIKLFSSITENIKRNLLNKNQFIIFGV